MTGFSFSSLRVRLVLLVLFAVIPALGLILYTASEQRRAAGGEAQANALRLAQSVSSTQDDLFEGARQLLIALAQVPVVRGDNPAECNSLFSVLVKKYASYTNLGVVTPAGDIFCSGLPLPGPVNVADRAWFRRALESRDLVIGDYIVGRVTGKATLGLGYPVLDEAGAVRAVLYAGLDLGWLNKIAAKTQLPAGTTLTVIDRKGTILVRFPESEKWVGKSMPETLLVQTILRQGEGTAELPGMDGIPRLYGFSPLGKTGDAYVCIGVPKSVAFATANRILTRNLMGVGIVSALAFLAAWFGADLFVLRQVHALIGIAKRLSGDELEVRTRLSYGQGELGELARVFDQMAEGLQTRQAEAKRAEEQIQLQLQRITALREINLATTSTLDLYSVLNVLMEKIDLFLPYTAVLVWLQNRENGQMERTACWNLNEEDWKGRQLKSTPALVKAAVESKAPVVARNVQTDPRTLDPELYRRHGLVSYLGVPLVVKDEALGVLVFLTREEHEFTGEEIGFLSTLAGQAAIAIHNSQLHEQTKKQALELEKANKVKDEFLGFVSHELRTPLSVVIAYTLMMQDKLLGEINPEQEQTLEKVLGCSKDLLAMINSLLEVTRIQAGRVEVESHKVDLGRFLEDLKPTYDVPTGKAVTLDWDFPSDLPTVKTDSGKLRHILQNLINNAIKFTEKGTVKVSARRCSESERVEFKVVDTGIGIPQESLPVIFEMFRQVNGSPAKSGGVGLGLHIVKKFTEMLGGKIDVESEIGKGSTFTVTIPCGHEATGERQ